MADQAQILPINGPMDKDSTEKYVDSDNGVVRDRVNMRTNSISGEGMANVKLKGNKLFDLALPAGTNKVVGIIQNLQDEAIIYCIYNSNDDHSILRYFIEAKTVQKIWYNEPALGIIDANLRGEVIQGMLYWIQTPLAPKSFVIEKAVNFTNALPGDAYSNDYLPFEDNIFPLIKRPPQFAPVCLYTDTEQIENVVINFNNLRKKLWQFKYNYQYDEFQGSAYSAISKVPLPSIEEFLDGSFVEDITINNTINITINTGSKAVKSINVAVRIASNNNSGDFSVFRTIDKYKDDVQIINDDEDLEFSFLNNEPLRNINTDIGNRYFDDIPISANDLLLLDGKYLAMSMPVKGYDFKENELDYELDIVETDTGINDVVTMITVYSFIVAAGPVLCGNPTINHQNYIINFPGTFYPNSEYLVTIDALSGSFKNEYSYITGDDPPANYPEDIVTDIYNQIVAEFGTCPAGLPLVFADLGTAIDVKFYNTTDSQGNTGGKVILNAFNTPIKTLKRGQYHPFGFIYNDGFGRYNVVYANEEMYSPLVDGTDPDDIARAITARIRIRHIPPVWAESYRIAYLPNKSYTYTIGIPAVEQLESDGSNGVPSNRSFLKVNQRLSEIRETYPDIITPDYVWENGDRVRRVGDTESFELSSYIRTYDDGGQDVTESGFTISGTMDTVPTTIKVDQIEIYRPNTEIIDNIYFEIGEEHKVLNPGLSNRDHGGGDHPSADYPAVDFSGNTVTSFAPNVVYIAKADITGISVANFLLINDGFIDINAVTYNIIEVVDVDVNNVAVISTVSIPNGVVGAPYRVYDIATIPSFEMDFGDVYLRQILTADTDVPIAVIEDQEFSDSYISRGIDIGRVGAKIDSRQDEFGRVVRGENYIENTETNNLNIFLPQTTFLDVSDVYGKITGIEETGDLLKVMQEHKETSVYIGKISTREGDGNEFVVLSDKVFGSFRRYIEDRGTKYRRSIVSNNRYLYYFDDTTGEFIRSAANGQIAISREYKMQSYFDQKAKELREFVGTKDVITTIDNSHDEVLVSFIIGTEIETVVFSEKENQKGWLYSAKFKTASAIPENFGWYGDELFSFLEGKLYLHNDSSAPRNTFYGELQDCSITFISNKFPSETKRYSNINISSDKNILEMEANIASGTNYPTQKTILTTNLIRERENRMVASILKNIINRLGIEDIQLLYNGKDMIGETMGITLSNNDDSELLLNEVEVKFSISQ
jgi:hypothetical protein